MNIDDKYHIKVKELMDLKYPKCTLPRPRLKRTIFVSGWGEWLRLIVV